MDTNAKAKVVTADAQFTRETVVAEDSFGYVEDRFVGVHGQLTMSPAGNLNFSGGNRFSGSDGPSLYD